MHSGIYFCKFDILAYTQVGDVTESEFYWTKILKSKVCWPLNFFSNLEHVGWYNKFHGLKNPHFDSKIIKIEQETPEIQQYIKNTWHVSGTCRTRVGHVRLSPIYFLASRTPILTPRSSKLDKKHQRYSILSFFNKKLYPQVLGVCQEKNFFFLHIPFSNNLYFHFLKKNSVDNKLYFSIFLSNKIRSQWHLLPGYLFGLVLP